MNICFTSHRYSPLVGGYENQIKLLAENLSKHFPVKLVTFNLANRQPFEVINDVEVFRVKPQLVFFRVPLSLGYIKKISALDFDLLHAHGFIPVVSDLSVAYAKSRNKATVYTHHFDGNVQDAKAWNVLADFYNKTVARQSFRYADALVATTRSYAESSPPLKPHLGKVRVIPCFVDCEKFKPASVAEVFDLRCRLGLDDKKVVIFVGRIVPYKGLEYLIKAVEYAKTVHGEDLNLLVLGGEEGKNITGKSQYYQSIQKLVQESSVKDRIRFLGKISYNKLSAYYSLADVFALTSVMRGEAFGAVLLEALACGTPVVASKIAGVDEVLRGNKDVGCYFSPRDSCALAKALIDVAATKPRVTGCCREFVLDNYRLESVVEQYVELYSALSC